MDLNLFLDILNIDSTSGHEAGLARFLERRFASDDCTVSRFPADTTADQPFNLMFAWGEPKVVYCTHIDTVPPYIPPTVETDKYGRTIIHGRGSCDAKGQLFAMYTACRALADAGRRDFGLLLLFGEESGSYGAKLQRNYPGGEVVIVGEPTGNRMVSASKGTKAYEVIIKGNSFHSGYPQYGTSAIERFVDFVNALRAVDFPDDPALGATTYNIGCLVSDNPQNILSPEVSFRIYFRTTFASDTMVGETMASMANEFTEVKALGGDTPGRYLVLPGFDTTTVAFGSDAPHLTNYNLKALCGPGSILVAHTPDEHIALADLETAVQTYIDMYQILIDEGIIKGAKSSKGSNHKLIC